MTHDLLNRTHMSFGNVSVWSIHVDITSLDQDGLETIPIRQYTGLYNPIGGWDIGKENGRFAFYYEETDNIGVYNSSQGVTPAEGTDVGRVRFLFLGPAES